MNTLPPCPLCGDEPKLIDNVRLYNIATIRCDGTGHEIVVRGNTLAEAEALWRKLAAPVPVGDVLAEPAVPVESGKLRKIPLTKRSERVLKLAEQEARSFGHSYLGTEHILLGLLREGEGIAAHVLMNCSVNVEEVRRQTTAIVQSDPPAAPGPTAREALTSLRDEARRMFRDPTIAGGWLMAEIDRRIEALPKEGA